MCSVVFVGYLHHLSIVESLVDGPRSLKTNVSSGLYSPGETITITADSNPATRNYTWVNTTSNDVIQTGDSITLTADMLGSHSLQVVVCNTIPIPSAHTSCSDYPLNIIVRSKCCLVLIIF